MIEIQAALAAVAPHLDAVAEQEGAPVIVTAAERVAGGWRITYNTREFVETGDTMSALLGNLPVEVDDSGALRTG